MRNLRDCSRRLALAGSAGVMALCAGHAAFAAEAASGGSAVPTTLEEVVVTAEKKSENIQNVPGSISAISSERLEGLNVKSLTDYSAYLPGLNVQNGGSPGQTIITLRGVAPVGPGAVVGTYVDDTPLGSSTAYARGAVFELDLMPYDIDHLEVLRGPQGTLYGASAMGGILRYALRQPSLNSFSGKVGADLSTIDGAGNVGWGVRGNLNLPVVTDKLAVMVSAYDDRTPGYIDNVGTGVKDSNEVSQYGGRVAVLWKPADNVSVKLNAMWQKTQSDDNSFVTLGNLVVHTDAQGANFVSGAPTYGDLAQHSYVAQPFTKNVGYYSAIVNWDLDWASLVSATSYSHTTTLQRNDTTNVYGAAFPLFTGGLIPAGISTFDLDLGLDKFTQELRIASPAGRQLEWLAGAFYTHENSTNHQLVTGTDFAGNPIPLFTPSLADIHLPTNYEEIAGFGDLTYHLSDRLEFTAGARYSHNSQNFEEIATGVIVPPADIPGHSSANDFTWMVSSSFHITPDAMLYGRVATGYRPGGPNPLLPGAAPTFGADKLINYEAGLKTQLLDHRAIFNLSAFYIDWTNIQIIVQNAGATYLGNGGDAVSKGFELETALMPVEGLRLGLNAAYTDATLTSLLPSAAINGYLLGYQLPNVPKWSGSATADYSFPVGNDWKGDLGLGVRYVGKKNSSIVSTGIPSFVLGDYAALDLNAGVSNDRWSVRVFARNVTNTHAVTGGGVNTNIFNTPVQIDTAILQPRIIGVGVDVNF